MCVLKYQDWSVNIAIAVSGKICCMLPQQVNKEQEVEKRWSSSCTQMNWTSKNKSDIFLSLKVYTAESTPFKKQPMVLQNRMIVDIFNKSYMIGEAHAHTHKHTLKRWTHNWRWITWFRWDCLLHLLLHSSFTAHWSISLSLSLFLALSVSLSHSFPLSLFLSPCV